MEIHRIHPELLERQVRVLVVGCGGTGSAVVAGLPYLHQSLVAHGHPGGLHVTVVDGDTISPTNCVRQPFARSEIGLNKAIVLVNRLNLFWGLKWEAVPAHLRSGTFISRSYSGDDLRAHIVIGCVDTRAARAAIRDAVGKWSTVSYWSIWATMQTAGSSSWVSPSTSVIEGQDCDSVLRRSYFLR